MKEKKLKVKNDIVFKEIFSKKGNETFIQDFLSGLLKRKIEKVEIIKDVSLAKNTVSEKLGVIDIKATLDDNEIVDIEMQMGYYKNMEDRVLYYSSKLISSQLEIKEEYKKLKPVIVILILNYNIFPYEEYITESKTVVKSNEEYEIMKKQKFYFIELEKYRNKKFNEEDKLAQWLAFIDGEDKERVSVAMKKNKEIKKANEEYEYLTGDEEIKRLSELREKWIRDYNSGISEGYETGKNYGYEIGKSDGYETGKSEGYETGKSEGYETGKSEGYETGINQGEKKSRLEIAKEMLKKNSDIDFISDVTKLSRKEIERLKKK